MVRAREYAEAFGGGIARLIEAADAGLLTSPGEHGPHFRAQPGLPRQLIRRETVAARWTMGW